VTLTDKPPVQEVSDKTLKEPDILSLVTEKKNRIFSTNKIPEVEIIVKPPIYPQNTILFSKVSNTNDQDIFMWRDLPEDKKGRNKPLKRDWKIKHIIPIGVPGYYEYQSVLFKDSKPVSSRALSYCLIPQQTEPEMEITTWGTTFPLNLKTDEFDLWAQQASAVNLSWVQVIIDYNQTKNNNKYEWEYIDNCLSALEKYGIEPLPVLCGFTPYLLEDRNKDQYLNDFVESTLDHFKGKTRIWKIGLKPASFLWRGQSVLFSEYADKTSKIIKDTIPNASIICGDVSVRQTSWIKELLSADPGWINVFALEPEAGTLGPLESDFGGQIRHIQALLLISTGMRFSGIRDSL